MGQKESREKSSQACPMNIEHAWFSDSGLFFLIPENKIHASFRTCVEYFVQILRTYNYWSELCHNESKIHRCTLYN